MDALKQYRKDMEDLGRALAQIALGALKASEITLRMAAAVEASASPNPSTPEPPDSVRKTDPAPPPTPCKDHHVGSCSCDGPVTGPHFPAPAKAEAKPCRVRIFVGAYVGWYATVIGAMRGKKLRVKLDAAGDRSSFEDIVYAANVTLLEGSAPLPVYVPKAKAKT